MVTLLSLLCHHRIAFHRAVLLYWWQLLSTLHHLAQQLIHSVLLAVAASYLRVAQLAEHVVVIGCGVSARRLLDLLIRSATF